MSNDFLYYIQYLKTNGNSNRKYLIQFDHPPPQITRKSFTLGYVRLIWEQLSPIKMAGFAMYYLQLFIIRKGIGTLNFIFNNTKTNGILPTKLKLFYVIICINHIHIYDSELIVYKVLIIKCLVFLKILKYKFC